MPKKNKPTNQQEKIRRVEQGGYRFYLIGDQKLPSVTTILHALPEPQGLVTWKRNNPNWKDILHDAGKMGTITHCLCQNHMSSIHGLELQNIEEEIKQSEIPVKYLPRIIKNYEYYLKWFDEYKPRPMHIEIPLYHSKDLYAGTADLICEIDGFIWLVDIKTGKYMYDTYDAQLYAYKEALVSMGHRIDKMGVLRMGELGSEWTETKGNPELWLNALMTFHSQYS